MTFLLQDCLQNFLHYFMSLLTALIVKKYYIMAGIYFTSLKKLCYTKLERLSMPNVDLNKKIGKVVIK